MESRKLLYKYSKFPRKNLENEDEMEDIKLVLLPKRPERDQRYT